MPSAMPSDLAENLSDAGPWETTVRRFRLPDGSIIEALWVSDNWIGFERGSIHRKICEEVL
jgi:hypothetical protein